MFRKATHDDVPNIMGIIEEAQAFLKENGVNQWQNNYPNYDVIGNDVNKGVSYVLEEDGNIVATIAVSYNDESTYDVIEGEWLTTGEYCVVHRLAVATSQKGRGIAAQILGHVEEMCKERGIPSIKVDTHVQNVPMRNLLLRTGFAYCGIIFLRDGAARVAYEREVIDIAK